MVTVIWSNRWVDKYTAMHCVVVCVDHVRYMYCIQSLVSQLVDYMETGSTVARITQGFLQHRD